MYLKLEKEISQDTVLVEDQMILASLNHIYQLFETDQLDIFLSKTCIKIITTTTNLI
jgi:hypothetical protein